MRVPLPADFKVHDTLHDPVTLTVTATKTINAAPVATEDTKRRANATFVMLTRNSDLEGAMDSIRSIEDRFNARHGYPYVFLNDEEFSDEFKLCVWYPACPWVVPKSFAGACQSLLVRKRNLVAFPRIIGCNPSGSMRKRLKRTDGSSSRPMSNTQVACTRNLPRSVTHLAPR